MRYFIPIAAYSIIVLVMLYFLISGIIIGEDLGIYIAVGSILGVILLSIYGLFENSLMKYILLSTLIQFFYFTMDAGTAVLIGKSLWFAVIQMINFLIAGGLFALVISAFYLTIKKSNIVNYAGLYKNNQFLGLLLCVASLSLGGMPGFNIFVGEYLIYSSLFTIHPTLTLGAVFAGLVCLIFYFKICYTIFAGNNKTKINLGTISKIFLGILGALVIILGIIPQILFKILEVFV